MDKDTERITKEIQQYHKYLDQFENADYGDLKPDIAKLRHHVLFIHSSIENFLHSLVTRTVAFKLKPGNEPSAVLAKIYLYPFLEEMDYLPLVRACEKANIVTHTEFVSLVAVNIHRRCFAHPAGYKAQIKTYDNPTIYLKTMKELVYALTTVTGLLSRFDTTEEKHLKERMNILSQYLTVNIGDNVKVTDSTHVVLKDKDGDTKE